MANDTYTADANGKVFAGRFNRPSWVINQAVNTWGVIPASNVLADLNPKNNPDLNPNFPNNPEWFALGGFTQIIGAWCGASYDFINDELRINLPAGHADYAGAEPYGIELKAESPEWKMLHPPSGALPDAIITNDGQDITGLYADGRPRAVHSYNKSVFIPNYGHAVVPQGSTSHGGQQGTTRAVIFDQYTGEMSRFGSEISGESGGIYSGGASCYDPSRESVWVRRLGTGSFHRYHVPTDTWFKNLTPSMSVSGNTALEYIPGYDCIVWLNTTFSNAGEVGVIDCSNGQQYRKPVSGTIAGMQLNGSCRPHIISANQLACWNNSSETTLINVISFDTHPVTGNWSVNQMPVTESNAVTPSAATPNGTFGRFFHSKNLGILGVINHVSQPIYFYRYK